MMKKFIFFVCALLIGVSVSAQKNYKVGDYYNENGKVGVVFWVDESGEHGKIVSLKERVRRWARKSEDSKIIGTNDRTDGEKNMAVVQQIPGWKRKYPAFAWCAKLGEGWYLPAVEELLALSSNNYVKVNQTLKKLKQKRLEDSNDYPKPTNPRILLKTSYWSSTWQCCSDMGLDFDYIQLECARHSIRAISKF